MDWFKHVFNNPYILFNQVKCRVYYICIDTLYFDMD